MPLDAKAQRLTMEAMAIEFNFARKRGIGMRRFAETNPAFIAEHESEMRVQPEVPGNVVAIDIQIAPAFAFLDSVFSDMAMEGNTFRQLKDNCSIGNP